jgi:hypothetical protein
LAASVRQRMKHHRRHPPHRTAARAAGSEGAPRFARLRRARGRSLCSPRASAPTSPIPRTLALAIPGPPIPLKAAKNPKLFGPVRHFVLDGFLRPAVSLGDTRPIPAVRTTYARIDRISRISAVYLAYICPISGLCGHRLCVPPASAGYRPGIPPVGDDRIRPSVSRETTPRSTKARRARKRESQGTGEQQLTMYSPFESAQTRRERLRSRPAN